MSNNLAFGILDSSANHIHVEGLQQYRPIAAFSFIGRFRVVDFPLSNMSNSGISQIQVYVRENPRSLTEHIRGGGSYNINSKSGSIQVLFSDANSSSDIYNTDIAGFQENISLIERMIHEYVVIAPSYYVFKQDFSELLNQHIASNADITLLYHRVTNAKECFLGCDTLTLNRQKGVEGIDRNRGTATERNIFMDTYIMKRELFIKLVRSATKISSIYTLSQVVNLECKELDVRAVPHHGYFAALTSFKSYFESTMDLLDPETSEELFTEDWPIYTVTSDSCPTLYYDDANVTNSLVSNGCQIHGTVSGSILGRGVTVMPGATVKNCILEAYCVIGPGIHLENQVIDKWAQVIHVDQIISPPDHPGYVRREDVI